MWDSMVMVVCVLLLLMFVGEVCVLRLECHLVCVDGLTSFVACGVL